MVLLQGRGEGSHSMMMIKCPPASPDWLCKWLCSDGDTLPLIWSDHRAKWAGVGETPFLQVGQMSCKGLYLDE